MIVLGLVLVLIATGAIVVAAMEPSATATDASFTILNYSFAPNHLEMFVAGAVVAAVLLIGIAMVNSGARRASVRRRESRHNRHEAARLEEEKRALERRLEHEVPRQNHDRLVAGSHRRTEDHPA
ncbi:hypothetical protein [Nonomuraea typhae]|uniref:LapA family protein n=1 Tax=Nonomuraea typhae TaxID=2603600 RepID=A0ABW7Z6V4_9ACTN